MNVFFLFLINSVFFGVNVYVYFGGLLVGIVIGYYYGKVIRRRFMW